MDKQKNNSKNAPNRLKPILKFIVIGSVVVALAIVILIILGPIIPQYESLIRQTSLPDELYLEAFDALENTSIDAPIALTDDVSLRLNIYDCSLSNPPCWFSNSNHMLCISGYKSTKSSYTRQSRIFVNGTRAIDGYDLPTLGIFGGGSAYECFEGDLKSGLHLIEFHLRDSRFGAPIAIQQWAIEID